MAPPMQTPPKTPQRRSPGQSTSRLPIWLLAFVVLMWLMVPLLLSGRGANSIPYSRFLTLVQQGHVVKADIGSQTVTGVYRSGGKSVSFVTTRPPGVDEPQLLRELAAHKVEFSGTVPSGILHFLGTVLTWVLPLILFVGVWLYLLRRLGGGMARAR